MSIWEKDPTLEPLLRTLVAEGRTAREIAKALGAGRNTIIGKANRLGLAIRGGDTAEALAGKRKARGGAAPSNPNAFSAGYVEPSAPRRFSWETSPEVSAWAEENIRPVTRQTGEAL